MTWHPGAVPVTARSRHHAEEIRGRASAIRVAHAKASAAAVKQGSARPPGSMLAAAVVADHLAAQVAVLLAPREMVVAVESLLHLVETELGAALTRRR